MNREPEKSRDQVMAQYTRQAAEYARSAPHSDTESLSGLVRFASLSGGGRVLDVATGTGFTAFAFAEAGFMVTGLDLTAAMLSQARNIALERGLDNIRLVRGGAEELPFATGSFSGVTCRVSAHHFSDVPRFLEEAARVLEPGGAAIIADTSSPDHAPALTAWFNEVETLRDPSHRRNFSPSQWGEMAQKAGLEVEGLDYSQRVKLRFSSWVARAGTPPEQVDILRERFAGAGEEVKAFFEITEEGEEMDFSWPLVRLKAVKP
jgi:SAM-dependent methyltransferase